MSRRSWRVSDLPGFARWVERHGHDLGEGEAQHLGAVRVLFEASVDVQALGPAWFDWHLAHQRQLAAEKAGAGLDEVEQLAEATAAALARLKDG